MSKKKSLRYTSVGIDKTIICQDVKNLFIFNGAKYNFLTIKLRNTILFATVKFSDQIYSKKKGTSSTEFCEIALGIMPWTAEQRKRPILKTASATTSQSKRKGRRRGNLSSDKMLASHHGSPPTASRPRKRGQIMDLSRALQIMGFGGWSDLAPGNFWEIYALLIAYKHIFVALY